MRAGDVPVNKYTIFTQLGKDPKDYPNPSMPAVQVALKLIARGKHVKAKDVMSFVICGESEGKADTAAKNAHPLDEVLKAESGLQPDIDYYLHKQILPPVERLCAPIGGTNVTLLAECLGLDTSKYRVHSSSSNALGNESEIHPLESQIADHIRFKDCESLKLLCLGCKHYFQFSGLDGALDESSAAPACKSTNAGLSCPRSDCGRQISNMTLVAQLETQIRAHTARYYAGWLVCDEATCNNRTRQMSVYGHRCLGPRGLAHGCSGKMSWEYGEKALYNQLLYLQGMFDADKTLTSLNKAPLVGQAGAGAEGREKEKVMAENNRERFETAKGVVNRYLDKSGWGWVSMDSLFGFALKAMV